MANDEYNSYRRDYIDGYIRERSTEHLGSNLSDLEIIDENGLFNQNIVVTRIELANGLEFNNFRDYNQYQGNTFNDFDVDQIFNDYGSLNEEGRTKAIRVWSGNDHWLLPKESAAKYLYTVPILRRNVISNDQGFALLYFSGSREELSELVLSGEATENWYAYMKNSNRFAFLVAPTDTNVEYGTDVYGEFTIDLENTPEDQKDTFIALFYGTNILQSNRLTEGERETITIPGTWETLSYAYLVTAPIHQKFAPAEDDLKIPLYGGTIRLVFTDGTTYDITTRSTLSYFYTMKELREYTMPTVENPITTNPFDWDAAGYGGIRHVPMVIVNPSNPKQRKRVLDSFDSNVTSQDRESYVIEVNSKTMYEPTLQSGFKILSYPEKRDLSYMDKQIEIKGMRVALVQVGSETEYFNADDGTLFVEDPTIYDHELCIGNLGNTISRKVYGQKDENSPKYEVMTLTYPVVEPEPVEVLAYSGVAVPESTEENPATDEEIGQLTASMQIALGASEVDTLPSTTLHPMLLGRKGGLGKKIKRFFSNVWKKIKNLGKDVAKKALDQGKQFVKENLSPEKLMDMGREVFNSAINNTNILKEDTTIPTGESRILLTSCLVPPLIPELQQKIASNATRLTWGEIFSNFDRIRPHFIKGVARKIKKRAKIGTKYTVKEDWDVLDVKPHCMDMVMSGLDVDSTEDTQTVKIMTCGQQQAVVLHHPQAVSNGLIGIRMRKPPINDQVNYGEQTDASDLEGAEFVAVDSNNNDVPLTGAHLLGGISYLTASNGGIIANKVKWSSGVANGQVDVEIQSTTTGMLAYQRMGATLSTHLQNLYTSKANGSFLHGISSLFTKVREFVKSSSKVVKKIKKGISHSAGKLWKKYKPTFKYLSPENRNYLLGDPSMNSSIPDEEPAVIVEGNIDSMLSLSVSVDSQVEDILRDDCQAILFDSNFPSSIDITLSSLQEYFKNSPVALLNENDEELQNNQSGTEDYTGTGFDRSYIAKGQVEIQETLCRDLLEFGVAQLSWNGTIFEIGGEGSGFLNQKNHPSYSLVMTSAPEKQVYVYGNRNVDLTGASWDLVDTSKNNEVIIAGLTSKNILCEPIPLNIEEVQLEIPSNDDQKTTIQVHFMGFINEEIKITILAPFMVGKEEMDTSGEVSDETANSTLALASNLTPVNLNLTNSLEEVSNGANSILWPTTSYQLLKSLHVKAILKDNQLHQKVFPIEDMSETLANKVFTVRKYDPTIEEDIQQVEFSCMGYSTTQWISRVKIGFCEEDNLTQGEISEESVKDTTPDYWDGTTPEKDGGQTVPLEPDSNSDIMQNVYNKIVIVHSTRNSSLKNTKFTHPIQFSKIIAPSSIFSAGRTKLGCIYRSKQVSFNRLLTQSTGLRHHLGKTKFFKKLWSKIKKIGKTVGSKIIDVSKKIGTKVYEAGKKYIKEHGKELLDSAVKAGVSALSKAAVAASIHITKDSINYLYSTKGVLKLNSLFEEENESQLISSGIRAMPYKGKDGKRKLAYVFSAVRRLIAGFIHRNPSTVPGTGLIGLYRRYPDPYPSKMSDSSSVSNEENEETTLDVVDIVPISMYEEGTTIGTEDLDLDTISIYTDSFSFSAQELIFIDQWPSLEEFCGLVNIYIQQTNNIWISIPLSHPQITVENYSNIDDALQQVIKIHLQIGGKEYTIPCVLALNGSTLSPINTGSQGYIWFINHPFLDNVLICYHADRRYNDVQELVDGSFEDTNGREADEQQVLIFENRSVQSIRMMHDYSASSSWKKEEQNHKVIASYNFTLEDGSIISKELYVFTYKEYTPTTFEEVILYDSMENTYINKDNLIFKYDPEEDTFSVIGVSTSLKPENLIIPAYLRIVDKF